MNWCSNAVCHLSLISFPILDRIAALKHSNETGVGDDVRLLLLFLLTRRRSPELIPTNTACAEIRKRHQTSCISIMLPTLHVWSWHIPGFEKDFPFSLMKVIKVQLSVFIPIISATHPVCTSVSHHVVGMVGFLIHLPQLLPHFKHVIFYFHNLANKHQRG